MNKFEQTQIECLKHVNKNQHALKMKKTRKYVNENDTKNSDNSVSFQIISLHCLFFDMIFSTISFFQVSVFCELIKFYQFHSFYQLFQLSVFHIFQFKSFFYIHESTFFSIFEWSQITSNFFFPSQQKQIKNSNSISNTIVVKTSLNDLIVQLNQCFVENVKKIIHEWITKQKNIIDQFFDIMNILDFAEKLFEELNEMILKT